MDMNLIPHGEYCYTIEKILSDGTAVIIPCPFWSRRQDKEFDQSGYCSYMKMGDWENDELTLLFDQIKECGVNIHEE